MPAVIATQPYLVSLKMLQILLFILVSAAPKDTGNCISGKLPWISSRVIEHPPGLTSGGQYPTVPTSVDVSLYDFVKLFGEVDSLTNGSMALQLRKPAEANVTSIGTTITSTRYMLYGRVTVELSAIDIPGAISTFITYSDIRDEIDWEMVGNPVKATNNVFVKSLGKPQEELETGMHGGDYITVPNIGGRHTYVIDWKHDSITWEIDGKVERTLLRSESRSKLNPQQEWFPNTPSLIQFGVWDASYREPGTVNWAGGNIQWSQPSYQMTIHSIDIQCYDDNDNVVPKWPANAANPDKRESMSDPLIHTTTATQSIVSAPTASSTSGGLSSKVSWSLTFLIGIFF